MATNPMAKKARNSFLLGVMLMLIISLIAGLAFYFLVYKKGAITSGDEKIVYAFRLTKDVKYGEEITSAMVEPVTISEKVAPAGTFNSKVQSGKKWIDQGFMPGYKAKVDLKAGTILGTTVTYSEELDNDIRLTEYNMITLPTTLSVGDTIDIRMSLGSGADLVVVSKKQVKNIFGNTITLNLSENEILLMNSAIVEAYLSNTANIYAIQYIDAGMQKEATGTYVPSSSVRELIASDPNIVTTAKNSFTQALRDLVTNELSNGDAANLESGIKTQIENARKAREAYLNGLLTY